MPMRLVVLVSGSGTLLQALIDASLSGELDASVVAVGADRADAYGLVRAEKAGIPTFVVPLERGGDRAAWDASLAAQVAAHQPDLVVSAGFMKLVGPAFLARFGEVSFKCPNRQTSFDVCRLDRIHVPEDYLRECSEQLREKLTPVGRLDESGVALLMDEQGRVFGGMVETADVLWLIGVSGADAINNLVAGNVARRVI